MNVRQIRIETDGTANGTRVLLSDGSVLPVIEATWRSGVGGQEPKIDLTLYGFRAEPLVLQGVFGRLTVVCEHCHTEMRVDHEQP